MIIYVQTDNGTIVIETNDDKIAVMIEKAGGVKFVDQANKREYHIRPGEQEVPSGEYKIEVSDALAGLEFQVDKFELKRGKEVRLTARFEAKGDGKVVDTVVMPSQVKRAIDNVLTASERKRARDRIKALKELEAVQEASFDIGRVTFDQVLAAKREVDRAELDLCESDMERVKIHETIVDLTQDQIEILEAQFQSGAIQYVDVLKAKADLQEALTNLARAKAKAGRKRPSQTGAHGPRASLWR